LECLDESGAVVPLGGPRQQATLAMLLLEVGNVIPIDRLIDAVWDDDPPTTARAQIQICISTLRRNLVAGVGGDPIETRPPGYLLRLGQAALDAQTFDEIAASARARLSDGDPAAAAVLFREALALWRGPALSNVTSRLVQQSVTRLNERRLAVREQCIDAELAAGMVHDLVGELIGLVQEHPLREHFHLLLMKALYNSGRQAEALEAYRAARTVLLDELGIEPGRELQMLHRSILNGEALAAATPPARTAAVRDRAKVVPAMLPAAIPDFTGRRDLVEAIVEATAAQEGTTSHAVPLITVYGPGGVGKTTLAIHAAHRVAAQFPDGHLFARLRNGGQAVDPADVLERFLRVLGVDGASVPEDVEERAELYRDLLGRRRMLVVLDDGVSEQQIRHLLPGEPQCAVLVTSRRRLSALPAAAWFEVGPLSSDNAADLVGTVLGPDRVRAEPGALAALCATCGNLPLALRIAAARLAARPHWSIAGLVDRIADTSHQLDELDHGDLGMRASISMTYDSLSPDARRLFRLLALTEAPNVASWVGAPLLNTDVWRAEELIEELTEAYLLDVEPAPVGDPPRYRFHDIMRPFAQERVVKEETPASRQIAMEALMGALLYLADESYRREYTGDYLRPECGATRWPLPDTLVNRLLDDPLSWYEHERMTLSAAIRQSAASGLTEHAWGLALAVVPLFEARAYITDWRESHLAALRAAGAAGDRPGEAAMRYSLGSLHLFEQQLADAVQHLTEAQAVYEELGDRYGTALVLRNLAVTDRLNGDFDKALERWEQSLTVFEEFGDRIGEAYVLYSIAQIRIDRGDLETAGQLLDRATLLCEATGNRRVGSQVQYRRGTLLLRSKDKGAAVAFTEVLSITEATGDRVGQCYARIGLASSLLQQQEPETAKSIITPALAIVKEMDERLVLCRVLLVLTEVELTLGRIGEAVARADCAVHAASQLGSPPMEVQSLIALGRALLAAGEDVRARDAWLRGEQLLSGLRTADNGELAAQLAVLLTGAREDQAGVRIALD
jgi:DNA-binding SARP family transcriptional activator/tetratricopeptide (TPR) repeat protein